MTSRRRDLLALPALAMVPAAVSGQGRPTAPVERLPLWPGDPPGGPPPAGARGTISPSLHVYRPARPDGRAVLVIPGGGYGFVALDNEGSEVAEVLSRFGITAFVLEYRLPGDGWADRANVPLADAQRALRLIRASAPRLRIDALRVSALGFSAGGHLAGALATLADVRAYAPLDSIDRESARLASAALGYAVSNLGLGRSFGGSRANLLGPNPSPALVRRYAVDQNLAGAPPLFLFAAEDDQTVPVINTLDLAAAARFAKVPVEVHLFSHGGHGFGVRLPRTASGSIWPELYDRWLAQVTRTAARGSAPA